ncbi:MAG: adenosylmethionine--8-amino-7-oxononanoate transaminase [Gammaproteobacteria bacterium]|nr:adenosylmethionine--8-amino-7-oxononanoate transaminase [Gammaproteobacteria bacterium]
MTADLLSRDAAVLWHPCTQQKDHEHYPLLPIARASGVWLEDVHGKRYLDAISSWWTNVLGHANPRINAALKDQLDRLEHVIFSGCTHEPAVALAERLVKLAPPGLTRCFYNDNGASAVETALKMSYHFWRNAGKTGKTRFVALKNSYHGETLGALAVTDIPLFKETYAPLLMESLLVSSPDAYQAEPGQSAEERALAAAAELEELLSTRGAEICAVIVEPLVQGAAGMRMYDPVYLRRLRELCDRYQVHFIADEIAVGFGRTGTLFACEQAGVTPDLMCLSKGLTGGYLPQSILMTTETFYEAFYADYASLRAFLHSHSYAGNPLACRAALATLDIFEQDRVLERNKALSTRMHRSTLALRDHPHVAETRTLGMIHAIELVADKTTKTPYDWRERRGMRVYTEALKRGAFLRPLGSVVYFMPPYVITEEEIDWLAGVAAECIDSATRG